MIKHLRHIIFILIAFFPVLSSAQNNNLAIVNHFNQPLKFIVGLNPTTLPDLMSEFILPPNQLIRSQVVISNPEAYIRVEDNDKHYAFWGVEYVNSVKFYGYLSNGIAFSWENNTITFCTPDEYKQKHRC